MPSKGDLIIHNGSEDTTLSVGTDGHVLTADAAEATGRKWASAQTLVNPKHSTVPVTNKYCTNASIESVSASTRSSGANYMLFIPIYLWAGATFTRVGCKCASSGAVSAAMGIYTPNEKLQPDTLVESFGTVSLSTTGEKEITISSTASGLHVLGIHFNAAGADITGGDRKLHVSPWGASNAISDSPALYYWSNTSGNTYTGTMPSTVSGSLTAETGNPPFLWMRVV